MYRYCPNCGAGLRQREIEGEKRFLCPKCHWIHYQNPLPSAAALVKNNKDEVLLVKRGIEPGKGQWALPSGFIEIHEAPDQACLRELEEETGLKGKIVRLLGVYSQKSSLYRNVLIIGYEVKASGKIIPGSDSLSADFFSPQKLPAIPFSSHRDIIQDGLKVKIK